MLVVCLHVVGVNYDLAAQLAKREAMIAQEEKRRADSGKKSPAAERMKKELMEAVEDLQVGRMEKGNKGRLKMGRPASTTTFDMIAGA